MLLQVDAFECTGTVSVVRGWQGSKSFVIAVVSNYLMIMIISDLIRNPVSTFVSSVYLFNWCTSSNKMVLKIIRAHSCIQGVPRL
jgi:hypothetical protein